MSTEANMFDGFDNAPPPGEGGVYFKPGQHIVRIDRFFRHTNLARVPGTIAEMTILHSTVPTLHAVGSAVSWIQRANKLGWQGRCRRFGAEVQGVEYAQFDQAAVVVASGPSNTFAGKVVMAVAIEKPREGKSTITEVSFKRLPPDALAQWTEYAKTIKVAVPMAALE